MPANIPFPYRLLGNVVCCSAVKWRGEGPAGSQLESVFIRAPVPSKMPESRRPVDAIRNGAPNNPPVR